MKVLASFYVDCGRMGSLNGLFISDKARLESAYGYEVYFSDVLGKHSEFTVELDPGNIAIKSEDQDFIAKLAEICGSDYISGINPLDYVEECDESETQP